MLLIWLVYSRDFHPVLFAKSGPFTLFPPPIEKKNRNQWNFILNMIKCIQFTTFVQSRDFILSQIRGGAFNPGWQYDANALEFSHQRELNHQRKQRTSFGTYQVCSLCLQRNYKILRGRLHKLDFIKIAVPSLMKRVLADFLVWYHLIIAPKITILLLPAIPIH